MKPTRSIRPPKIAVLIPCYNEQATIAKVVVDIQGVLPEAKIFVFDNNSTDHSARLAEAAGATVVREKRQGKGFVVMAMLKKIEAEFFVLVDGDDTYPAGHIGQLLQPLLLEEADMVVGNRLATYAQNAFRPLHLAGNRIICAVINAIFSSSIEDPMSGFRALTRELAKELPVTAVGFDVETEMTLQALYRRFKIREIDIPYRIRPEASVSKLRTFRDGFLVIVKVMSIALAYKPLTFFGAIGIVLGMAGVILVLSVIQGSVLDQSLPGLFRLLSGLGAAAIGFVSVAIGLILHTVNVRLLEISSQISKRG